MSNENTNDVADDVEDYLEATTEEPLHKRFTTEQLVDAYIQLKDSIKQKEDDLAEALKPDKKLLAEIETSLSLVLEQAGGDAVKTRAGTAAFRTYQSFRVVDRMALDQFTRENDAAELYESRVAKTMAARILEETGSAPPGVELSEYTKVVVTRPRTR